MDATKGRKVLLRTSLRAPLWPNTWSSRKPWPPSAAGSKVSKSPSSIMLIALCPSEKRPQAYMRTNIPPNIAASLKSSVDATSFSNCMTCCTVSAGACLMGPARFASSMDSPSTRVVPKSAKSPRKPNTPMLKRMASKSDRPADGDVFSSAFKAPK